MAKIPQGNADINKSIRSQIDPILLDSHHDPTPDEYDLQDILRNLYNRTELLLSEMDPIECVGGDCPTVEIPIIIVINDVTKSYANVELGLKLTAAELVVNKYDTYEAIAGTIETINEVFATGYTDGNHAANHIIVPEKHGTEGVTDFRGNPIIPAVDFG